MTTADYTTITLPDGNTDQWYTGHRTPTHAVVCGYTAARYTTILDDRIAKCERFIESDRATLKALMIDNTADTAGRFYRQMLSHIPGIWTADPDTVRTHAIDHITRRLDNTCDTLRDLVHERTTVAANGTPVRWNIISTHSTAKAAAANARKVSRQIADRNGYDLVHIVDL